MNMPGFTAEASLYETSNAYVVAGTLQTTQLSRQVYPQILRRAWFFRTYRISRARLFRGMLARVYVYWSCWLVF